MNKFLKFLYYCCFTSSMGTVHAKTSLDSKSMETRTSVLYDNEKTTKFASPFFLNYETYTSAPRPSFSEEYYSQNVLLSWRPQAQGRVFSGLNFNIDSTFVFSAQEEWIYPKISEAYVESGALRVGIVNENWADFEEEWRLGLYRPRFMNNKLSGGQGGVLGAHVRSGGFQISALPIYIPELGPQFEEQNGRLVSRNPWFDEAPETLTYNDVTAPIRYSVEIPPLREILLNPGLILSYENRNEEYRSRYSAAYKPLPQILLNFPADGRFIIGSDDQYFHVEVRPVVAYHTVFSSDQEYVFNQGRSRARVSLAHEIPNVPDRPQSWVTQELREATFLSARMETEVDLLNDGKIFVSQFKVWGGDLPDQGRFASDGTYFEVRQFFREAYGLGLETSLIPRLKSEFKVMYDFEQKGGVFSTRQDLFVKKDLRISAAFEMLGLTTENPTLPDGFISRYRANDRAEVGVTYAF